ncbi:tRNA:m(4)X modification enzyme TRM13 homolog isoform X2 [Amblyomma americanum]
MSDTQCAFIVPKKGRRCRLRQVSGSRYCGEHIVLSSSEDSEFFIRNINSGTPSLSGGCVTTKPTLKDIGDERLWEVIHKIDKIFDERVPLPEQHVRLHEAFSTELRTLSGCAVAEKHLTQKAALLGLAEHHGLLARESCFIEFGAGRGRLSYWLAKILPGEGCRFLLIDKAASRHKFENKLKREQADVPDIRRLQVDIQHLCLGKVDLVRAHQGKLVGLCKHLCGEATDFALRCLVETASDASSRAQAFRGVLMATCCHHRCRWDSFVGRPFLESLGLDRMDFELLICLAGWATCTAREARAAAVVNSDHCVPQEPSAAVNRYVRMGLSVGRREEVGRRCKLLLDEARARYLGSATTLSAARLVHFVARDVTPENVAILATSS